MRVLDLFAGIGCFSLGLERVGFNTVAFCENEPFCRAVIRHRWPAVPLYNDIRDLDAAQLAADGIAAIDIDVICGGFPCTDISIAGAGVGIAGRQSRLWREFARLAGELRPDYLIVENTSALLVRGLDVVLGDLAALGFDVEWHCLPATYVGAPHLRDRIWIVAYPGSGTVRQQSRRCDGACRTGAPQPRNDGAAELVAGPWAGTYTNTLQQRLERQHAPGTEAWTVDRSRYARDTAGWWWQVEPGVGRVVDGCPDRMERLRALGNAAVPQIIETLGAAILAHARVRHEPRT